MGHFSSGLGEASSQACSSCPRGTHPALDQSQCLPCGEGTLCPEGVATPIVCLDGLRCNGVDLDAGPGMLPVLVDACTGIIPCPHGTLCADGGEDKGLLASPPGKSPYFVVHLQGGLLANGSCGGISYGYARVDPLVDTPVEGLFFLRPRECPPGSFLEDEDCVECPAGTFSPDPGAVFVGSCRACGTGTYSHSQGCTTCLACGPGSFQEEEGASSCEQCPVGTHQMDQGRAWCDSCLAGSFSQEVGQSMCTTCPADTVQAGSRMSDCKPCNGSLEFSSPGDARCRLCGSAPDPLEEDSGCPPARLPAAQEAVWIAVQGVEGDDECAGGGGLVDAPVVRFFEGARCRKTLKVLGRPELSSVWVEASVPRPQSITGLRVVPYDHEIHGASCRRDGFGFLFVPLTGAGQPAVDGGDLTASFSVLDLSGKHLLFQGGCSGLPIEGVSVGRCHTSAFCPRMDVMARVTLRSDARVQGVGRFPVSVGLQCPPVASWAASFRLDDAFLPRFPGALLRFEIDVLNPPSAVLAFRFKLQVRPGFTFVSFAGAAKYHLEKSVLSVEGDSTLGGHAVGALTLRLDAEHHGVLRAFRLDPDGFQVLLDDGVWLAVGVQTDAFTCLKDGFAAVLADHPRVTSLQVFARRPWLVHWGAVQEEARVFPLGVRVLAVWNNAPQPVLVLGARCKTLSPRVLAVDSCHAVSPRGVGDGMLRVDFMGQEAVLVIPVVEPSVTGVRLIPDASGRRGRISILAVVRGSVVEIAPFVVSDRAPVSPGAAVSAGPFLECLVGFVGNVSVGRPTLLVWPCGPPQEDPPDTVFLLSGDWTSRGVFRLGPSVLSSASGEVGLLFFRGARLSRIPVVSRDPSRAEGGEDGRLRLVRHGYSPRCVPLLGADGTGWSVRVVPPAPSVLSVLLSRTVLVVEQDMWKLVPSHATVSSAVLGLSDGSSLDVTGDPRLVWTTSQRLQSVQGTQVIRALAYPGEGYVSFGLLGISCVRANVSVQVFESSVVSGELLCPSCPPVLAVWGDPLGALQPARFPVAVPAASFVLRRLLVDGTVHDSAAPLHVQGGREAGGSLWGADEAGVLKFGTDLSDTRIDIQAVRRWVVKADARCNGHTCDDGILLTVPGNGAALEPFLYADSLELTLELTLFNGTVVPSLWLDGVSLSLNETLVLPGQVVLLPGEARLRVVFGPEWMLAEPVLTATLRVVVLSGLRLDVPPVLYQLHCSGLWDIALVGVQAVLTSGVSAAVQASLVVDGLVLQLDRAHVRVGRPGEGHVNASFGGTLTTAWVLATSTSRLFTRVSLDSVPDRIDGPSGTHIPITPPALTPPASSGRPALLLEKVVRWVVSQAGVLGVDGGGLTLLSDFHDALELSAVIRSCQGSSPVVVRKRVQVNVAPDRPGQADFGAPGGPPLPLVPVGARLTVPVFLFTPSALLSFHGILSLPGLDQLECLPGELPFSACVVGPEGVAVSGDFPVSQRSGRLLIGSISGRVLLNTLARLSVSLGQALTRSHGDVGNSTSLFVVRLGVGEVLSILSPLNAVVPGQAPASAGFNPGDPMPRQLGSCCDVVVTGRGSFLERWIPSEFALRPSTLLLFDGSSLEIGLTDPRIQVAFDSLVLELSATTGRWLVRRASHDVQESTTVSIRYVHPLTLQSLGSVVRVTLAKEERLVLRPAGLVLRRIHCSPVHFQRALVQGELVLRGGSSIPLGEVLGGSLVETPGVARVSLEGSAAIAVTGTSPGLTRLVLKAFGMEAASTVSVLDESILVTALRLANPYVLSLPWMGVERVRVGGVLGGGLEFIDATILHPSLESDGPVTVQGLLLVALGNTHPADGPREVRVGLPGCEGGGAVAAVSVIRVSLVANLTGRQRADVLVDATSAANFTLSLEAPGATVFSVELFTEGARLESCSVVGRLAYGDCVLDYPRRGGVVVAGIFDAPLGMLPERLVAVSPMPASVFGSVEVFTGNSSTSHQIVAGRFGSSGMAWTGRLLPVVDTATLSRHARGDRLDYEIGLLTGRTRLIDMRLYSNERELSVMFRVTDRFLQPDVNQTTVLAVFDADLPPHPHRVAGPGMKVLAQYVMDGWYAVQWLEPIPAQRLRVSYEASTTTSRGPWNSTVSLPLSVGRPLHSCPRFATDTASFLLLYEFRRDTRMPDGFRQLIACAGHVALRRVTVGGPDGRGVVSVSVAVESFIRIQQAHAAIMNLSSSVWPAKGRRLLQLDGLERVGLAYINETGNETVSCPHGFFFSTNGSYEHLPQHATAGLDCYGMSCIAGYVWDGSACSPAAVPLDVIRICVLVIVGLILLVSCVLCAMHFGRTNASPPPVTLQLDPWPVTMKSEHLDDDSFQGDEWGFRNVVIGSYQDELSRDMMDDDDLSDDLTVPSRCEPGRGSQPAAAGRAS